MSDSRTVISREVIEATIKSVQVISNCKAFSHRHDDNDNNAMSVIMFSDSMINIIFFGNLPEDSSLLRNSLDLRKKALELGKINFSSGTWRYDDDEMAGGALILVELA